jgi:iron-sulfur cluster repair protein YtfE (RIC family)
MKKVLSEMRLVVEELEVEDDFDEKALYGEILKDYEETFNQKIPKLQELLEKILRVHEIPKSRHCLMKNQPEKDVFPITFLNSGFFLTQLTL